jgi:hypothetical protein
MCVFVDYGSNCRMNRYGGCEIFLAFSVPFGLDLGPLKTGCRLQPVLYVCIPIYIYMRYLYHIETLSHTGCLKYNINEIPNSRTIVFGDILEIYHWFNRIYIYIYHDISNCCILLPIISFDILVNYTINGRHWCTNKKYRKMTPWINWFMDFSILASSILYHPSIATDRWNQQETPCPIRALLCFSAAANLIALARKGDLATEDDTVNTSGLCFMFLFPLCWWFTHFIYVYIILSQIAWSNPVHFRN